MQRIADYQVIGTVFISISYTYDNGQPTCPPIEHVNDIQHFILAFFVHFSFDCSPSWRHNLMENVTLSVQTINIKCMYYFVLSNNLLISISQSQPQRQLPTKIIVLSPLERFRCHSPLESRPRFHFWNLVVEIKKKSGSKN